jgi:hypothetical protein
MGLDGEARRRMTAVDATATIGGSVGRKLLGGFDGAHTLQQIGLKTLRTPTATLTLAKANLKAIAVAPEPARRWKPQPPKLDQDGLTKSIRFRRRAYRPYDLPDRPQSASPRLRQFAMSVVVQSSRSSAARPPGGLVQDACLPDSVQTQRRRPPAGIYARLVGSFSQQAICVVTADA